MDKPNFLKERKLLGKRIMQLRNNCMNEKTGKKISQEELALRLGLAKNHIGLIERGQTNTTVDVLYGIAKEFKIDIISLFDFNEL
ncbi:helix-turn-helix domain-containing protein [Flavobacterium taihuense]|jgi:transcriptional regulator with XRE-family HTH domain|uniref:Helix-turn-helix domain-containing protein n=1 Tax=Flavobacterium taihuense TaxID=2857508 RepID=A0ABS6XV62_9FLAO|nr:helix-turn-helix transcriptional regulator [Flavobacterium taihuense]MBW4360555.1 helix-turn-helix domain-containing protein [Flavobacterium taihuense]